MKIGVLWDLDGTLLDTLEDLKDSVNYALDVYGCPERSLEEVRSFVGNGAKKLIALSLPVKEDDPDVDQVLSTYQAYYATHAQVKTCPYAGILQALEEVGKQYPMAIVSNKPDKAVKMLCKEYFGDIFARGESTDCLRKPAPDMLFKTMEEIGVDTCIYVGDSEVDVITAGNAKVPGLSVLWGFRDKEILEQAGAKHFCSQPDQLLEALNGIAASL